MPKIIITTENWTDCTYCNKTNIETEQEGAPISGFYPVCKECRRIEAEFYDDKKGLIYQENETSETVYTKDEIKEFKEKLKGNICDKRTYDEKTRLLIPCNKCYFCIKLDNNFKNGLKIE